MEFDETLGGALRCGNDVHVWLGFPDEPGMEAWAWDLAGVMSDEERRQQRRFHFERDRRCYLVTRVLARHVLSRYVGVEPAALAFATNAYGRPQVANPAAASAAVRFNISHTNGLIALAIVSGREVGVDVENVRDREATLDIANRFFAPDEVGALRKEPVENQAFRFFEYWTFKESYIKARGMGLGIPLNKFSFRFPARERVELSIASELDDDPRRWAFVQLMPTREHLLAACIERSAGSCPSLIVRRFGPDEMNPAGTIEIATPLRSSNWTTEAPCAD